jgi:hypothetical protein
VQRLELVMCVYVGLARVLYRICTVHDRIFHDFPAKKHRVYNVIYGFGQPYVYVKLIEG